MRLCKFDVKKKIVIILKNISRLHRTGRTWSLSLKRWLVMASRAAPETQEMRGR